MPYQRRRVVIAREQQNTPTITDLIALVEIPVQLLEIYCNGIPKVGFSGLQKIVIF